MFLFLLTISQEFSLSLHEKTHTQFSVLTYKLKEQFLKYVNPALTKGNMGNNGIIS